MSNMQIFNVWNQGADVYQDPLAVADAIDLAEVLGVQSFDLLVDAYTDVSSAEGARLRQIYEAYLKKTVAGENGESAPLQRQLADGVRQTDQEKWLQVVARAAQRVVVGPVLLRRASPRFFAEAYRSLGVAQQPMGDVYSLEMIRLARAVRGGEVRSAHRLIEFYREDPKNIAIIQLLAEEAQEAALEGMDELIGGGEEAAVAAGQKMDVRKIEIMGHTPFPEQWLRTIAEWGNASAVWSLIRLKSQEDIYADQLLTAMDPAALGRLAQKKEEARRAVEALAVNFNSKAIKIVGDWILAGQRGYAQLLYQIALEDGWGTLAIDQLGRVAREQFVLLEWMFRLLKTLSQDRGGRRYRQTLALLKSFPLGQWAAAARRDILAFYWLVKLGNIGHPLALAKAAESIGPLQETLADRDAASVSWMLQRFAQEDLNALAQSLDPHAQTILRFIQGARSNVTLFKNN